MRKSFLIAAGLLLAGPVLACDYPQQSLTVDELPNGATASMDQMLEAQAKVRDYVAAMEDFIECVDAEFIALAEAEEPEPLDAAEQERWRVMAERRDAAVELVHTIAEEFNTQVRVYQETNQ